MKFTTLIFLSSAAMLLAAPAVRIENEAQKLWDRREYGEARPLYLQAGEQRLKEAELIVVGGQAKKADLLEDDLSFDSMDNFGADDDMGFGSMLESPVTLGRDADNKADCYVMAAFDFERAERLDKAEKCYPLAIAVPHQTIGGKTKVKHAYANFKRLNGEYEESAKLLLEALETAKKEKLLQDRIIDLYSALAETYSDAGMGEKANDAHFAIINRFKPNDTAKYDKFKKFVTDLVEKNRTDAALDATERFLQRPEVNDYGRSWALIQNASTYSKRKEYLKAIAAADEALKIGLDPLAAAKEGFLARLSLADSEKAWEWMEGLTLIDNARLYGGKTSKEQNRWIQGVMSFYGYTAYRRLRADRARHAYELLTKRDIAPSFYTGYWLATIRTFDEFEKFPRREEDIIFPKAPEYFGTAKGKTIRIKDSYDGFNPTNMTAVIQEIIDRPDVGTIIFDKMDAPWRISQLRPRSNQTFIFEKGVVVLADVNTQKQEVPKLYPDLDMFMLECVTNVAFIGLGDSPADVYIGKYQNYEERRRWNKTYGGSGFGIAGGGNIAIYNMTIAECSCDGISVGGLKGAAQGVYVKDVVLESNYRQACSLVSVDGIYFKNVTFADTRGNSPMCGIDIEPSIQEVQSVCEIYLFDCIFKNNNGAHINFSCSSSYPVTLHAKRCTFEPNAPGCLNIFALPGIYFAANSPAWSKIIFEECLFKQYSDKTAISIENSSFFNVSFKNSKIVDVGTKANEKGGSGYPFLYNLKRYYGKNMTYKYQGLVEFDTLQIEGYKERPPLSFIDTRGSYAVTNLTGKIVHNGKEFDAASFRHIPAEADLEEIAAFDGKKYTQPKAAGAVENSRPQSFFFADGGAWYDGKPVYTAIWHDNGKWNTRVLKLAFDNMADICKKPVAYQCKTSESLYKLGPKNKDMPADLYFEVPAGARECVIRVNGVADIVSPSGKVAAKSTGADVSKTGAVYLRFKPESGQSETWCLRLRSYSEIKFFAPLSGIIAENAEWLPKRVEN